MTTGDLLKSKTIRKLAGAGHFSLFGKLLPSTCLLLGASVFTADQLLKASIERQPEESFPRDAPGSNGAVRYEKRRNDGFLLGAFRKETSLVRLLPAFAAAFLSGQLLEMLLQERGRVMEKLGLTLVVSGALSNVYDRFKRGYVVDYLSIQKGFLRRIVVNLGDIAICTGAAFMALGALFRMILGLSFKK